MEFWSRIGVTQSGGARFETGRCAMPKSVHELLRLVYLKDLPLRAANGIDLQIAALLRKTKPALYEQLRKRVAKTL